jgi:predicted Mrr-cat superfamily restriction endonuclease
MAIWRLVTHHFHPQQMLETYRNNSCIAMGWGQVGDIRALRPTDAAAIRNAIKGIRSYVNLGGVLGAGPAGRSLWGFYSEMQCGDLVILSIGHGPLRDVFRVTGDYEWRELPIDGDDYNHYRAVEPANCDGKEIWGRHAIATGWNKRWALIQLM